MCQLPRLGAEVLDEVRFTTTDPAQLRQELDRLVRAVRSELEAARLTTMPRFRVLDVVHGKAGSAVSSSVNLGDMLPLSPAQGSLAVQLPRVTPRDSGKLLAVVRRSASNTVTLYPGAGGTVNLASSLALPAALGAYLFLCDGSGFWAVNDAV